MTAEGMLSVESAATRGEVEGRPVPLAWGGTITGADGGTISGEMIPVVPRRRRATWKELAIATMLPFAQVFDPFPAWRCFHAETANAYVIFIGEEEWQLLEAPHIVVVSPMRQTLRFRQGHRVKRLPPRPPFIPLSSFTAEEE